MRARCTQQAKIVVDDKLYGRVVEGHAIVEKEVVVYPEERPLHPVEVAYLLLRDCAKVFNSQGHEYTFQEFIVKYSSINPHALAYLEVYHDLRSRGRLPIPGPRENSLLLLRSRRKPDTTHYILVLEESTPVTVTELTSFVEEARHNNLIPVLAIVDRYGDITYYTPMIFHPRGKPEEKGEQ